MRLNMLFKKSNDEKNTQSITNILSVQYDIILRGIA